MDWISTGASFVAAIASIIAAITAIIGIRQGYAQNKESRKKLANRIGKKLNPIDQISESEGLNLGRLLMIAKDRSKEQKQREDEIQQEIISLREYIERSLWEELL